MVKFPKVNAEYYRFDRKLNINLVVSTSLFVLRSRHTQSFSVEQLFSFPLPAALVTSKAIKNSSTTV